MLRKASLADDSGLSEDKFNAAEHLEDKQIGKVISLQPLYHGNSSDSSEQVRKSSAQLGIGQSLVHSAIDAYDITFLAGLVGARHGGELRSGPKATEMKLESLLLNSRTGGFQPPTVDEPESINKNRATEALENRPSLGAFGDSKFKQVRRQTMGLRITARPEGLAGRQYHILVQCFRPVGDRQQLARDQIRAF